MKILSRLTSGEASATAPDRIASTTWSSVEEMRRGLTLMRQGVPYFAWQGADNSYRPSYRLAELAEHEQAMFNGDRACGFYSIRPDNLTRWGAIDFDNHDGEHHWLNTARTAFDGTASMLPEAWLVESSPGGYHIIGFDHELKPAAAIRVLTGKLPR